MTNNKDPLQQEILAKVKVGVKPSDLKKQQQVKNINPQLLTPPDSPIIGLVSKKQPQAKNNSEPSEPNNQELLAKIKELEAKNKSLVQNIAKLTNQQENKENSQERQKLFTCYTCQKNFSSKLIRLVDKNNRKICRDCLLKMLNRANQITGEEIILRKKKKETSEAVATFICAICQQQYQGQPHQVHINNYQEQGIIPQQLTSVCSPCLEDKVILADFYCPRTSEGRDTYQGNEFDCFCPRNK